MRKLAALALLMLGVSLASAQGYIGRLDTVGSTTYDWQNGWHAVKCLVNAPGCGLHATWIWSDQTSGTTFDDRNMRYNYYYFGNRRWIWPDSNRMNGGVNVYLHRAGNGNIDYDPATGAAIICCHYTGTAGITPKVAKDEEPGACLFDFADGEPVLGVTQWPRIAVGQDGTIHLFTITAGYVLGYSRILPGNWPNLEPPRTPIDPSPGFPTFNMAASKVSGKVCLAWEISTDVPEDAYMQTSADNGETWTNPELLPAPPAYGGDTVTAFHITSLYPWYDFEDRLHVVANVCPQVNDTVYIIPSQIWHWCEDNSPQWSRIHVATCDPANLLAPVGYNATYADRPSIGEGNDGRLYVAWEQFDSSNVEPTSNRLRAGIWVSGSADSGLTWTPGRLVSERNTFSHRFPSIVDRMVSGGPSEDTICILYMIDSVSGFFVQSEGPATFNPMVCQFIPSPLVGTEEVAGCGLRVASSATIVRGVLVLPEARSEKREARSELLDISGRRVLDLRPGANDVSGLSPGVYFVRAVSRKPSAVGCHKVVLTE